MQIRFAHFVPAESATSAPTLVPGALPTTVPPAIPQGGALPLQPATQPQTNVVIPSLPLGPGALPMAYPMGVSELKPKEPAKDTFTPTGAITPESPPIALRFAGASGKTRLPLQRMLGSIRSWFGTAFAKS